MSGSSLHPVAAAQSRTGQGAAPATDRPGHDLGQIRIYPDDDAGTLPAGGARAEADRPADPASQVPAAQRVTVQRQDEREPHFSLLPPELRLPLGPLDLTADTGNVQLGYRQGPLGARLGYDYGGDISAGLSYGGLSTNLGVNPGSGAFSLGASYDQFRLGASASPSGAFGASLGYGSPLLPMPGQLSSAVYAAETGLRGLLPAIPGALDDPLGFYQAQGPNISALTTAGGLLGSIAGQQQSGGSNFGAGLQINYDPELRAWSGSIGAQARF